MAGVGMGMGMGYGGEEMVGYPLCSTTFTPPHTTSHIYIFYESPLTILLTQIHFHDLPEDEYTSLRSLIRTRAGLPENPEEDELGIEIARLDAETSATKRRMDDAMSFADVRSFIGEDGEETEGEGGSEIDEEVEARIRAM